MYFYLWRIGNHQTPILQRPFAKWQEGWNETWVGHKGRLSGWHKCLYAQSFEVLALIETPAGFWRHTLHSEIKQRLFLSHQWKYMDIWYNSSTHCFQLGKHTGNISHVWKCMCRIKSRNLNCGTKGALNFKSKEFIQISFGKFYNFIFSVVIFSYGSTTQCYQTYVFWACA